MGQVFAIHPLIDQLRPVRHRANIKTDTVALPHYYIRGLGAEIESIAGELVENLRAQPDANSLNFAVAAESNNDPGRSRPLRVIHTLRPGHVAVCDVNLMTIGHDLYVRIDSHPRTRTALLRKVIYVVLFVVLWTLAMALFADNTQQFDAMARDYAKRAAQGGNESVMYERIRFGRFTDDGRAWSYVDYFRQDPIAFLTALGRVPVLAAAAVGGLLLLIPADWIRWPCDWLKYPRPAEFRNKVNGHVSRTAVAMSDVLAHRGVFKDQMIPVNQL